MRPVATAGPVGFSCMLGNPPWERVKLQEQEFFAARDPEVAQAPNAAARRRLIKALETDDPALYGAYLDALREASGQSAFLRLSGRYPLNGRGDVNTYAVFTELFRSLTGPTGRSGVIAPTGIATDATTQYFFKDLVARRASLAALLRLRERASPSSRASHRSIQVLPPDHDRPARDCGCRCLRVLPSRPLRDRGQAVRADPGGDHAPQPQHGHLPGVPHPPRRRDHPGHLSPRAHPHQ
jgi:hypothetical protein